MKLITRCPESVWYASGAKNAFRQVAYHTLFYTPLYLQPSEKDFAP